jgi:hypothetical protein
VRLIYNKWFLPLNKVRKNKRYNLNYNAPVYNAKTKLYDTTDGKDLTYAWGFPKLSGRLSSQSGLLVAGLNDTSLFSLPYS